MKKFTPFGAVFFASVGACLLPLRLSADETPAVQATFVDEKDAAEVCQLGEQAISRIGMTLINEASSSVNNDGALHALDACHLKNVTITNGTVAGMPRITAMKRTSLKVRDPANAPDAAEALALHRVEVALNVGRPPRVLVQRIDLPGGKQEWRVYRPIAIRAACLACHGAEDQINADVRAALKQRYPNDQAMGYSVGEWRGLLRVTVADAPPPAAAKAGPAPAKTAPTKSTSKKA